MRPETIDKAAALAAIVEASCDAILSHDLDGTILTWNRGAEAMFGYTEGEAVGQPVSLIVPPDRSDELVAAVARVSRGERVPLHETVRATRKGALLDVAVTFSPVHDDSGEVRAVASVVRDSTEQRWMADTLNDIIRKLEASLAAAQQSEARYRRFLSDAAHQLRSPVAGIRACTETVLRGSGDADRDRLLAEVAQEATRAGRLVASLLSMARLQQAEAMVREPCDVAALCTEEVDRTRTLHPTLEVVVRVGPLAEPRPRLDAASVGEMLANLLDNASRHAATCVEVAVEGGGGGLEIRVADDGPGMPKDTAERAFERFATLDGMGGSGLGLPIAREVARCHGGDLVYEGPEVGFVARLPLHSE